MIKYYSSIQLSELKNNKDFIDEFEKYKLINKDRIDKLLVDIKNKNRITFNLTNDSERNKQFNNIFNKLNKSNIKLCIDELNKLKMDIELYELIIDKCIVDLQHIESYIEILIYFKNITDINIIIDNKIGKLFEDDNIDVELSDYEKLCLINKKIDKSCGLCILVSELESKKIINNYIINVINMFFDNIIIDDNDICDRYINSLFSIFKNIDKRFIVLYMGKLEDLKNKDISKKNKFKIMDIFDLKNK